MDNRAMALLRDTIIDSYRPTQDRIQAIHSLRKFGREALPYFREILHSGAEMHLSDQVRKQVVEAVADMGVSKDDEAWEILISRLEQIVNDVVRASHQPLCGVIVTIPPSSLKLADDLCRGLVSRGGERVASLMKGLLQVRPEDARMAISGVSPVAAESYYRRFRNNVLRYFSALGDVAVPYLEELLDSPDPDVREIAAHALAELNR